MSKVVYAVLVLHVFAIYGDNDNYFCEERFTVVSDLSQNDCLLDENGRQTYLFPDKAYNCFPACVKVADGLIPCGKLNCAPGYKCLENRCKKDPESCEIYHLELEKHEYCKITLFNTSCEKDYSWKPKQCKGEAMNGRCFCYDKTGHRIFGHEWSSNSENMTCACSVKKAELEKDPNFGFVSLHCDSRGNYEPLQCNGGQCWCTEPKTGELTSQVVPEKLMTYLPCYEKKVIGEVYLRQCESELYARSKIMREFSIHGTTVTYPIHLCDADGSYGRYHYMENRYICTWRDKSSLTYGAEKTADISQLNCNCAWDKELHKLEGRNFNLNCAPTGDYEPEQIFDNKYYCVDSDGFRNSIYSEKHLKNCTKCSTLE